MDHYCMTSSNSIYFSLMISYSLVPFLSDITLTMFFFTELKHIYCAIHGVCLWSLAHITSQNKISMKFVPKGPINNIPALVQIMAWRRPGDKPLSEPTRTTRTPAFWGYPPPPHDYPYHWVILDPKSKDDKVKVTNFKLSKFFLNFKFLNFETGITRDTPSDVAW